VVDTPGSKPKLADLEATPLTQQHVGCRYPHVGETQVHVAVGRIVLPKDLHRPHDFHAGGVHGHQDLTLLLVRRPVRAGADHHDHDLAAGIARTRDVELFAVDQPFVSVEHRAGGHVACVAGGHVRLGHGKRRPDPTVQQRLQPPLLLLGGPNPFQHFHVPGVGCGAVEAFGRQWALAQLCGDVGVTLPMTLPAKLFNIIAIGNMGFDVEFLIHSVTDFWKKEMSRC
jgi:hypothetical protein